MVEGSAKRLRYYVFKMIKNQAGCESNGENDDLEGDGEDNNLSVDGSMEAEALSKISHLSKHRREVL